jgi:hypothetical protein
LGSMRAMSIMYREMGRETRIRQSICIYYLGIRATIGLIDMEGNYGYSTVKRKNNYSIRA